MARDPHAAGALAYAQLHHAEALGSWRVRAWAEWRSAASGTICVPLEVCELSCGVLSLCIFMLLDNLGGVTDMLRTLGILRIER